MRDMYNVGKKIRYERIFRRGNGKVVMIPMDHGIVFGPMQGIEKPAETVRKVVAGGADAVIMQPGIAKVAFPEYTNRCASILHLTNPMWDQGSKPRLSSVEQAVRMAADGVSIELHVGSRNEAAMIENARIVSEACDIWGMPLLLMMYYSDDAGNDKPFKEQIKHCARAGAELGADIVKVLYTGDPDSFREVVEGCPVPVVIAGGPKKEGGVREVLQMVREAIDAGAAGIAIGRNTWGSDDPTRTVKALVKIIHEGASVDEAMAVLKS